MTAAPRRERVLYRFFEISLLLKAMFAGGEILAAIGAYVVPPASLAWLVAVITRGELAEDPRDLVANLLVRWAHHLSISGERFLALYLLSHGIVKLWLVAGMLRQRLWYYPVALVLFGLFIVYQLYRFSFTGSAWLLLITTVDLVVVLLTWHEYGYLRRSRVAAS